MSDYQWKRKKRGWYQLTKDGSLYAELFKLPDDSWIVDALLELRGWYTARYYGKGLLQSLRVGIYQAVKYKRVL